MAGPAVSLAAVREARERLAPHIHLTPVLTSATLDRLAGRRLFFKCENLQKGGSFKLRGALNAVLRLDPDVARRGVVTHSSGNFAQALAIAGRARGIPVSVVMPEGAPEAKRAAAAGYGARVVPCAPTLQAREATAREVCESTGAVFIHPYDAADVIAGQGTLCLELLEQAPELDAVVAPVGGGGLVTGIAVAAKGLRPQIRVYAAEPEGADDAARSKAAGERVLQTDPRTIADGLRTSLGELTWPTVRDLVDRVVTVSDQQILDAMRLLFERMKLVVEPSGSVALAATLTDWFRAMPGLGRVGVVLSGGNVDLDALPFAR